MNETLLYTLPQWVVFAAIFVMVYGWIEEKRVFRIIGALLFVLLGIFAVYIFMSGFLEQAKYLTPDEIASQELDDETMEKIPILAKLGPAYISFILSGILVIPAIFLDLKNKKSHRIFLVLSASVALAGFFVIVGALKYI